MGGWTPQPSLQSLSLREDWEADGSKTTGEKAVEMVRRIIANHNYNLPAPIRRRVLPDLLLSQPLVDYVLVLAYPVLSNGRYLLSIHVHSHHQGIGIRLAQHHAMH